MSSTSRALCGVPLGAALAACHPGPPNLLLDLEGRWAGEVVLDVGDLPATAAFTWSDESETLLGEVLVVEPGGQRDYEVFEAVSVEELGVSLHFVETAGVRELFLDALVPLDPFEGAYRTSWYCGEGSGFCETSGSFSFRRD